MSVSSCTESAPRRISGSKINPRYVRVVNGVENGKNVILCRVARHYVREGRGAFIGEDQFWLNDHPANTVLRTAAAAATETMNRVLTLDEQRHVPIMPRHRERLRLSIPQLRRRHQLRRPR